MGITRKFITILLAIFLSLMIVACGDIENTKKNIVPEVGVDNFVSAEIIDDINSSVMLDIVKAKIDPNTIFAFGYRAVKIIYKTKGQNGDDINASGLLTIPIIDPRYKQYRKAKGMGAFSISMINENHGTIFTNSEAPSVAEINNSRPDIATSVLFTSKAGFASINPDYIGYGESNNTKHPYIMKKASAQASIDMIRASIKYMNDNNYVLNGQLYLTGYSEGGYVAMAVAQEIQKNYANELVVKGLAPMAGPYQVEKLGNNEIDANKTMEHPAFLAYLGFAYGAYYDDINLSEVINYPNISAFNNIIHSKIYPSTTINVLLGLGDITNGGIKSTKANVLFKDSFIHDYKNNNNNSFKVRLDENRVDNWTPNSLVNLIHCKDDEIIPHSMTISAKNKFIQNGMDSSKLTVTSIPTVLLKQKVDFLHPFVHSNCGPKAYGAAVQWFSKIRSGEIK